MSLIFEEVIMPDRHMSDRHISEGQLHLFFQLLFNTKKN